MEHMVVIRIVLFGSLLLVGCEYAAPSKDRSHSEQRESKSGQNLDSPDVKRKPAYILADPAEPQNLTGINGGQRFTFEPPDYGGEWTQENDTDLVRFYVVDLSGAKNVAVAAESFSIKAGDNLIFSLDPDVEEGSGSHSYSLDDRNLALAMNSMVEVIMVVNGKSYRAILNDIQPPSESSETTVDD